MANWLSRMFTIPRKKREELAKIPGVNELAAHLRDLAVSVAQGVVDEHVSDPVTAEKIKQALSDHIEQAIPIHADTMETFSRTSMLPGLQPSSIAGLPDLPPTPAEKVTL